MTRQQLMLYRTKSGSFHSIIKTKHGRIIYLEITLDDKRVFVKNCYYLDRVRGDEYYAVPQKFNTRKFLYTEMLDVIASELDRKYFGIEITDKFADLSRDEFIDLQLTKFKKKYKFLILVGSGDTVNDLPKNLTTRLANRIHRKIYLRITYYRDNLGVVEAYYYDRRYKARSRVTPQMLTTVFVEYSRNAIIDMVNRELDCDFTDIIIADNSINIEENEAALCGNI